MLTDSLAEADFQLAELRIDLDLTVELTDVRCGDSICCLSPDGARPLLVCDRCHDIEEIVVAMMRIVQIDEAWALCGPCLREMPTGFKIAEARTTAIGQ